VPSALCHRRIGRRSAWGLGRTCYYCSWFSCFLAKSLPHPWPHRPILHLGLAKKRTRGVWLLSRAD
jgi:hypothetical protein